MTNPFEILESRLIRIENLLAELRQDIRSQKSTVDSDDLLTIDQISKQLNLAVQTIYGLVSRREIPVYKRGKRLYFSKKEILEWVKAGRIWTMNEIEADAKKTTY